MKMKKFIAVVSMVGMLAAAMTGCGSGSDDAKDADKGGDAKYAGDWDSANDITVVSREDGSGTRGAFIELFGIQEEVDGESRHDDNGSADHKQYFGYDDNSGRK